MVFELPAMETFRQNLQIPPRAIFMQMNVVLLICVWLKLVANKCHLWSIWTFSGIWLLGNKLDL